jgi:hypothetical protein
MTTSAFFMMVTVQIVVTVVTGYFLMKVLKTPPKTD